MDSLQSTLPPEIGQIRLLLLATAEKILDDGTFSEPQNKSLTILGDYPLPKKT
jgi:hypothetical protein